MEGTRHDPVDGAEFAVLCAQAAKALEIARLAHAQGMRDFRSMPTRPGNGSKALEVSRGLAGNLDALLGALLARLEAEGRSGCGPPT